MYRLSRVEFNVHWRKLGISLRWLSLLRWLFDDRLSRLFYNGLRRLSRGRLCRLSRRLRRDGLRRLSRRRLSCASLRWLFYDRLSRLFYNGLRRLSHDGLRRLSRSGNLCRVELNVHGSKSASRRHWNNRRLLSDRLRGAFGVYTKRHNIGL